MRRSVNFGVILLLCVTFGQSDEMIDVHLEMRNLGAFDDFDTSYEKDGQIDATLETLATEQEERKKEVVVVEKLNEKEKFRRSMSLKCGGKCGMTLSSEKSSMPEKNSSK